MPQRATTFFRLAALLALTLGSAACSIQQEVILGVDEGAEISVSVNGLPAQSTTLSGGIRSQLDVNVSFLRLLLGLPLNGTIEISEILIAADKFFLVQGLSLNTAICQYADPADPGGGTVSISLGQREAAVQATANALALPVNPLVLSLLGGAPLALPVEIDVTAPITLLDLLGVLGGATLPLSLVQDLDTTLDDFPPGFLQSFQITGQLPLTSVDTFPTGPTISMCEDFLDGFLSP